MYLQMNCAATITAAWKLSAQTGKHREIQETPSGQTQAGTQHKSGSPLNTQTRCVSHTLSLPPVGYISSQISASIGAWAVKDDNHAES